MAEFYNQAALSFAEGTVLSNEIHGEIIDKVEMTKDSLAKCYKIGDNIAYIVQIINNTENDYSALTLSDNLGKNSTSAPLKYVPGSVRYYINGELQPAITPKSTNPLIFDGISLPAKGVTTVAYDMVVNELADAVEDGEITTISTLSHSAFCRFIIAKNKIELCKEPILSIVKNACPLSVTEGDYINYSFTVLNHGFSEAGEEEKIVLSDLFNPRLSNISVSYNGNPWTKGKDFDYSETTGSFKTKALITVPAASFQIESATSKRVLKPGSSMIIIRGKVK